MHLLPVSVYYEKSLCATWSYTICDNILDDTHILLLDLCTFGLLDLYIVLASLVAFALLLDAQFDDNFKYTIWNGK